MKHVMLLCLAFCLLAGFTGCEKPTEPKVDPDLPPNITNFVWDIDTLQALPNYSSIVPADIWASSPTDVWIVGINPAWHGEILHYDGNKWNRVSPNNEIAMIIGTYNMDFSCIFGFGKDDIYVGGYTYYFEGPSERGNEVENLILHWDGISWAVVHHKTQGVVNSIYGNTPDEMWASGIMGTLLEKKHGTWNRLNYLNPSYDYQPVAGLPNGNFYMSAEKRIVEEGDTSNVYYYKYSNGKWSKIDSSVGKNNGGVYSYHPKGFANKSYWVSPEGNLFGSGQGLFKLVNDKWVRYAPTGGGFDMHGTSETNIYECGTSGRLSQFDGKLWHLSKWNGTFIEFRCVWAFEKEVFCAGLYQGNCYVVKGKLSQENKKEENPSVINFFK